MATTKKKKKTIKSVPFDIYIRISVTGERFLLKNVHAEMKIRELKCYAELVTGIPSNLQRLHYLDEGDMLNDTDLKHNDVVAGATINLKLWRMWEKLVASVALGSVQDVLKEGITVGKSSDSALSKSKLSSSNERSSVALYIASHRGHNHLLKTLVDEAGADVNMKTPFGRTPLHVAASQGHSNTIDLMLEKGASMDESDIQGKTPLMVASQCGFKDSERHLFLFQWQTRAAKTKARKKNDSLMMHQQFDSAFPVWLRGKHAQKYYCSTLPPGEFAGTGINAPRRRPKEMGGDRLDAIQFGLPPIGGTQVPEAMKQSEGRYGIQFSEAELEHMSDGLKYSHGGAYYNAAALNKNKKNRERTLSSKSRQSATSSKSNASQKTFEEWMEEKKEQKNIEKQKQKLRTQMETKPEHRAGRKVSSDTEKEKYIPPYRTNPRAFRRDSKEQYESLDEYPLYPTREHRRISSIREDPAEGLDYLRMSFDLWPRRVPSDAIL